MEDTTHALHRRMRIANLEARRELREIEREALSRTINSPLTSLRDRHAATSRRDVLTIEWTAIVEELQALQRPQR